MNPTSAETPPATILNSISWRDICPWLLLFKSIAVAFKPSIVFIAFVGLLLSPVGWTLGAYVAYGESSWDAFTASFWNSTFTLGDWWSGQGPLYIFSKFYQGHLELLNPNGSVKAFFFHLIGTAWMLGLWSVLGCMICRIAALHFTRDERPGVIEAFRFVKQKLLTLMVSSFIPLTLILFFIVPFFFVGLMMKLNVTLMLVGIGWFLVALFGLFMAVVMIPLFFGWPLLWPAIATEGSDPFDAISRSYSYPTQRPFHYVFYWVVIVLVGFLAAWLGSVLAERTIEFTKWGTSWGAGHERALEINKEVLEIHNNASGPSPDETPSDANVENEASGLFGSGVSSIAFWERNIRMVAIAFSYGFFFVACTGMYLLLRKDNDFMELDEIYVEENDDMIPLPHIQSAAPPLPQQLIDEEASAGNESTPDGSTPDQPVEDTSAEPSAEPESDESRDEDDEQPRLESE